MESANTRRAQRTPFGQFEGHKGLIHALSCLFFIEYNAETFVCRLWQTGKSENHESCLKIIEHGQRIRACLKQPEFAPVSVPAQNRPATGAAYAPVNPRLLPLDEIWHRRLTKLPWPTRNLPEIVGETIGSTGNQRKRRHEGTGQSTQP